METNLKIITELRPFFIWQVRIDYVGNVFHNSIIDEFSSNYLINKHSSLKALHKNLKECLFLDLPDILLLEISDTEDCFAFIEELRKSPILHGILIVLLSDTNRDEWKKKARELKVHDYYIYPFEIQDIGERIKFLLKMRIINPLANELVKQSSKKMIYRLPMTKRLFDIIASATALFLLSPLFIFISILIRIESEGPVIYRSKRAGSGYKVFDFYKFRSMQIHADKDLAGLRSLNQYNKSNNASAFIKIVNDPRVTKVGQFMRNTSLDELPQLFNILIGDMSFVGNRPLPLYEAELLTSNEWAMRFLGPAGLTGLWQVSKRGKAEMSDQERKELDNDYARRHSFWLDLKIIFLTFPALIQNEKV